MASPPGFSRAYEPPSPSDHGRDQYNDDSRRHQTSGEKEKKGFFTWGRGKGAGKEKEKREEEAQAELTRMIGAYVCGLRLSSTLTLHPQILRARAVHSYCMQHRRLDHLRLSNRYCFRKLAARP